MPDMTKEVLFEIVNRDVFQNDAYKDIVVEDDNDSRRITFSIARYYDEVDLSTKNVVVRYVNALSQYDEYLVHDAHHEQVMIVGEIDVLEDRRHLKLHRRHLVMPCAYGDAGAERFVLQIPHER